MVARAQPQQLKAVGSNGRTTMERETTYDYSDSSPSWEAHLSEADTKWQDYLFDQRMKVCHRVAADAQ